MSFISIPTGFKFTAPLFGFMSGIRASLVSFFIYSVGFGPLGTLFELREFFVNQSVFLQTFFRHIFYICKKEALSWVVNLFLSV